jgi:hypothetical protein
VSTIPVPAASGRSPVQLKVGKNGDANQIIFSLRIIISSVSVYFIQIADTAKNPAKRILRVMVDKIPLIQDIPLVDQLPQPFDQLIYMWVNDAGGLLESDVSSINDLLDAPDRVIFKQSTQPNPSNLAIAPGHHFTVINNGAVALDHVFEIGQKQTEKSATKSLVEGTVSTPPVSNASKGSVSKTLGPLSISAVSLQYKENDGIKHLFVTMDATFALGPISFGLLGFGIGLPMNDLSLNNLGGILKGIDAELHGLALGFDKPPILLAGSFEHDSAPGVDTYMGGLGISFPPYTFVAVGEYQVLNNYKSVFIYAKLDGREYPLVPFVQTVN